MPLFYQQDINETTRLGIWKIAETETSFLQVVPVQRHITHPHKRLQHLAGRYLLKWLYPDFPQEEIEIADTRKPFLPDEQYHFSISHCGDYAAAIVSRTHKVGIDIEMLTMRVERIKNRFLSVSELAFVHGLALKDQVAILTLLWSAKECLFKWWARGDVDFIDVLQTRDFIFSDTGRIPAAIVKNGMHFPLEVDYRMLPGMSLAWVTSHDK